MKTKNYRLSPSKLSEFRDNPRAFWLSENAKLTRPRGIFPSLPGGMDKVLKFRADAHRAKGAMLPELRALAARGIRLFPDQAKLDDLRMWQRAPKWTDPETGVLQFYSPAGTGESSEFAVGISFQTKTVLLDTDPQRALDVFRAAVACLRGPPPEAGPKEEWDGYAQNYARLVTDETRRAAA